MRNPLLCLLALQAASCASISTTGQPRIDRVWDDPVRYDGQSFDAVVYPNDILNDPDRYVMCLDACPGEQARTVTSVLIARRPEDYSGFDGDRPVRLRLRFDASCFKEDRVCLMDHRPYIFIEQ